MDRTPPMTEEERHWRGLARPMPARCAPLAYDELFTLAQSPLLERPVLPYDMGDKWMVFYDAHDQSRVSFHRSWTGICIYSFVLVTVDPDEEPSPYAAADALVNRDPSQYASTDDVHDAALLRWLVHALLLGEEAEPPVDPNASGDDAILSAWSFGGNAAFSLPPPPPPPPPTTTTGDPTAPRDG